MNPNKHPETCAVNDPMLAGPCDCKHYIIGEFKRLRDDAYDLTFNITEVLLELEKGELSKYGLQQVEYKLDKLNEIFKRIEELNAKD